MRFSKPSETVVDLTTTRNNALFEIAENGNLIHWNFFKQHFAIDIYMYMPRAKFCAFKFLSNR